MINVIVVARNNFTLVENFIGKINSIYAGKYRLIVVDDASKEKKIKLHNVVLIRNRKRLGFIKSVNKAFKHINDDVVIFNSTEFLDLYPGVFFNFLEYLAYSDKNKTCNVFLNMDEAKPIYESEGEIEENNGFVVPQNISESKPFCLYIRKELIDKYSGFNEEEFEYSIFREIIISLRKIARKPLSMLIISAVFVCIYYFWGVTLAIWASLFAVFMIYGIDSRFIGIVALIQLIMVPFFLIIEDEVNAEKVVQKTYFYLVFTVLLQIIEQIKQNIAINSFRREKEAYLKAKGIIKV